MPDIKEIVNSAYGLREVSSAAYKLQGKTVFQGMNISIETKKGQIRKGIGKDGIPWRVRMPWDYGYILRSKGQDGDHVDCFIGPDKDATHVYVIHQTKEDSDKYDEDKAMLGFSSADQALAAYKASYTNVDLYHSMSAMPVTIFKKKVAETKDKKKAFKIKAQLDGDYYQYHEQTALQIQTPNHPPSLKNPQRVKVANPDDEEMKVGKRGSKKAKKRLREIAEKARREAGKPEIVQTTLYVPINQG